MNNTQNVPTGTTPRPKAIPFSQMSNRVATEPKAEYIYSGIKKGSVGIVVGASKSGKTIYCENLLQYIAAGQTSYLGLPINIDNRKVLMVSFEEYYTHRTERQTMQVNKMAQIVGNDEWVDNFMVNDEKLPTYIKTDEHWKTLKDFISDSGAGIVILDSITRMCQRIEEMDYAQPFMMKLRELAHSTNTTIIGIHHTTKLYGGAITMDSIAGSRVIAQELDFAIGVNRSQDGKRYIKDIFFRYAQSNDESVRTFVIEPDCTLRLTGETSEGKMLAGLDGRRNDTKGNLLFDHIQAQIVSGSEDVATSELEKLFVNTRAMSKPTMHDHLKKLMKDNKIIRSSEGRYKLAA